jgi:hypothetical protein
LAKTSDFASDVTNQDELMKLSKEWVVGKGFAL